MDKQELFYGLQYLQDNGTSVCVYGCGGDMGLTEAGKGPIKANF